MELKEKWFYKEFTNRESEIYHNAYEIELYFYQAIRNGDLAYIERVCCQEHFEEMTGLGMLSTNAFKNVQYHFVVSVALAARACVEGGLSIEIAFSLSDFYIQQLDHCKNALEIDELTYHMNVDFTTRMQELHKNKSYSAHVSRACDYIYTHLHHKIQVQELADHVNLNRSHLSRIFKTETGYTIQEYIMREKIKEAKNMLIYSELTCNDIAHDLSFSSQSHFSCVFRQYTGLTPKEYRNQNYEKKKKL